MTLTHTVDIKEYVYKIDQNANGKYRITRKRWWGFEGTKIIGCGSGCWIEEECFDTLEDARKRCVEHAESLAKNRRDTKWNLVEYFTLKR